MGLCGLDTQFQGISAQIRNVLYPRRLIVVRQNYGISLFCQISDFFFNRLFLY